MNFGIVTWPITVSLILLGISLCMDSFAVSLTNGISYNLDRKKTLANALIFATLQALMPMIGFFIMAFFENWVKAIQDYDHYVAFVALLLVGGNMLIEGIKEFKENKRLIKENIEIEKQELPYSKLFIQGIATSIDALAVGFSIYGMGANIFLASGIIFIFTFIFVLIGRFTGKFAGKYIKNGSVIFGGVVLILIGLKILLEGLGIINF